MLGKKILSSATTEETEQIGRALAEELLQSGKKSAFIALYGDLGVGKTAFTRGFVSAICPAARVKSPTYTVVNEYRGGILPVFHFDMYRIDGEDDLYSTGFYDYLDSGYLLSEWSENIPFALPKERIAVTIEKSGVDTRRITLEAFE
ncbi:MAG: tRNA (adenosine(37)-N6)-threonylcarbamoyltransferase complex ATPase subunit type 1 TsaE [Clostridia bacterium]|nr:tRNA (adenosine(37)-N6)-threonylcarbamoyltransferase complex ATPase subunit type 1 TsaE [Clostridia bacterium]